MLSTRTKGVLSAVVLVAAAAGAFGFSDVRFWAWAGDLRQVAQDSYNSQITQISIWLTAARQQLTQCQASGGNCSSIILQIAQLEKEQRRLARRLSEQGG